RIAVAQRPASLEVARAGAELRAVERLEQPAAADLARDRGERILRAGGTRRRILSRIGDAGAGAAVGVANENAPGPVDSNVVEVEQIAARIAAALIPDAAALHRIGRRRIGGRPALSAVIGERDIQVPDAEEFRRLRVARRLRAEKGVRRAI